ncbi:MAG TPA: HNH endonuclease [Sedimentisphaerales bacterium]|nr:HNH endonuclease [Sedimentisphaerales bacterium]
MSRNEFQKNADRTRHCFTFHKVLDIVIRTLTLGVCNNKNNTNKWLEKYDMSRSERDKYTSLLLTKEKLDGFGETFEIEGVRISKHTFSDLSTIKPEDYGTNWISIRDTVLTRDCYECKEEDGRCFGPLQIHHVTPLSKGGTNESKNLITLCLYHHSQKHKHMWRKLHGNIRC